MKLFNHLSPKGYFSAMSKAATDVLTSTALMGRINGAINLGSKARKQIRSAIHEQALSYLGMASISKTAGKAFSLLSYLKETASRFALKRKIVRMYSKDAITQRIEKALKPILSNQKDIAMNQLRQVFNQLKNVTSNSWEEAFSKILRDLFSKDPSISDKAKVTIEQINTHIEEVAKAKKKERRENSAIRLKNHRASQLADTIQNISREIQKVEEEIFATQKAIDHMQEEFNQPEKVEELIKQKKDLVQKRILLIREKEELEAKRNDSEETQTTISKTSSDLLTDEFLNRFDMSLNDVSQEVLEKHKTLNEHKESLFYHQSIAHALSDVNTFLLLNSGEILPGAFHDDSTLDRLQLDLKDENLKRSIILKEVTLVPSRRLFKKGSQKDKRVVITQNITAPIQTMEGKKAGTAEIKLTYSVNTSETIPKVTHLTIHNPTFNFDFS